MSNLEFALTTAKYAILTGVALGLWYLAGIMMLGAFVGAYNGTMKALQQPPKSRLRQDQVSRWAYVCWPMFLAFTALIAAFWVVVAAVACVKVTAGAVAAAWRKRFGVSAQEV